MMVASPLGNVTAPVVTAGSPSATLSGLSGPRLRRRRLVEPRRSAAAQRRLHAVAEQHARGRRR